MDHELIQRYSRQLNLPDFDLAHQKKLAEAKVLVVGAGGLGSPLILYLAAAGIGKIGIIDFDKVELHNLHRQILYTQEDVGKYKVEVAAEKVQAINPNIECKAYQTSLSTSNVEELFSEYDLIADGTDNFPTRYLINDACVKFQKTNVFGSVQRYEGQVAVFNYRNEDGSFTANYRDLFPIPPLENSIPNCAEAGVFGPVVGMIACIQAQEIIRIASGMESKLIGKILSIDLEDHQMRPFKLKLRDDHHYRNERRNEIILQDYENICKLPIDATLELNSNQLIEKLQSQQAFKVIDIREKHEYAAFNIGSENIPLAQFVASLPEMDSSIGYIIHCQSGKRSRALLDSIIGKHQELNIYHLEGGLNQWVEEQGEEAKISE